MGGQEEVGGGEREQRYGEWGAALGIMSGAQSPGSPRGWELHYDRAVVSRFSPGEVGGSGTMTGPQSLGSPPGVGGSL
ncbi:hypothetical protein FKM82_007726 [Ascaphus truei]